MNLTPFYRRPHVVTVSGALFLFLLYLFMLWRTESERAAELMLFDLMFALVALVAMLVLTAQFILPVQSWSDRWASVQRLISYLLGTRGPVMFIENGEPVEGRRERERGGPGVLLVDAVSAAVLRDDIRFTRAIGPGIYFTSPGERLAESLDLRPQVRVIRGSVPEPGQAVEPDKTSSLAMTLDGIPVSADLSVRFVLDRGNVEYDRPPYEFGATGVRSAALAVYGHAFQEGDDVPWTEIPIRLVADLWREKVGKWPLDALVRGVDRDLLKAVLEAPLETREEKLEAWQERIRDWPMDPLRAISPLDPYTETGSWGVWAESLTDEEIAALAAEAQETYSPLRQIREAIAARLTAPPPGSEPSREFEVVADRGIRIYGPSVSNLYMPDPVRNEYFERWRAKWAGQARTRHAAAKEALKAARQEGEQEAYEEHLIPGLLTGLQELLDADVVPDRRHTLSLLLAGATALAEEWMSPDDGGEMAAQLGEIIEALAAQDAECWDFVPPVNS